VPYCRQQLRPSISAIWPIICRAVNTIARHRPARVSCKWRLAGFSGYRRSRVMVTIWCGACWLQTVLQDNPRYLRAWLQGGALLGGGAPTPAPARHPRRRAGDGGHRRARSLRPHRRPHLVALRAATCGAGSEAAGAGRPLSRNAALSVARCVSPIFPTDRKRRARPGQALYGESGRPTIMCALCP